MATEVLKDALSLLEKAEEMRAGWDQKYNPTEPILANITEYADLFIQYQQIRFPDDLFEEEDEHYYPDGRKTSKRNGSAIKAATPEQMLEAIATLPDVTSLAHSENIPEWAQRVRTALGDRALSLTQLQAVTGLSIVPLWLAVLFGGFSVKREGDFYEGEIFVSSATLDAL